PGLMVKVVPLVFPMVRPPQYTPGESVLFAGLLFMSNDAGLLLTTVPLIGAAIDASGSPGLVTFTGCTCLLLIVSQSSVWPFSCAPPTTLTWEWFCRYSVSAPSISNPSLALDSDTAPHAV